MDNLLRSIQCFRTTDPDELRGIRIDGEFTLVQGADAGVEFYSLADTPEAFREFASLPEEEEEILAWARRFGLLGEFRTFEVEGRKVHGEAAESWFSHIRRMRHGVTLWDMVRAGNREGLAELFRWDGTHFVSVVRPDLFTIENPLPKRLRGLPAGVNRPWVLTPEQLEIQCGFRPDPGDVVQGAQAFLAVQLNLELRGLSGVSVRLEGLQKGRNRLVVSPSHHEPLWRAMTLQFAQAIDADQVFNQCPVCGKWFLLEAGVNKADRVTCSAACRNKAYRQRKAEAVRLAEAGKRPGEIANELGSDAKTVKGWIAEARRKEK
jgi:hypothetical protein